MRPREYPIALSTLPPNARRALSVQRRVGRYIAVARTEEAFDDFQTLVLDAAAENLEDPLRLLILPHLVNAVGKSIPDLGRGTRLLIDGFLFELVFRDDLRRLTSLSRSFEPYQAFYSPQAEPLVRKALDMLESALRVSGYLSIDEVVAEIPEALTTRRQNVFVLLGHLLHLGSATTDANGEAFDFVRLARATS